MKSIQTPHGRIDFPEGDGSLKMRFVAEGSAGSTIPPLTPDQIHIKNLNRKVTRLRVAYRGLQRAYNERCRLLEKTKQENDAMRVILCNKIPRFVKKPVGSEVWRTERPEAEEDRE